MRPGYPARRSGAASRLLAAIAEQTAAGSRIRGRNRGSATPTSNHTKHKKKHVGLNFCFLENVILQIENYKLTV